MQYLDNQAKDLHIADVIELCVAFRDNRTHHRSVMRDMITKLFKKDVILAKWHDECEYHQRRIMDLMIELIELDYYDEEIWQKCWAFSLPPFLPSSFLPPSRPPFLPSFGGLLIGCMCVEQRRARMR